MRKLNNNFIFICSPSLGILDNWLPVICNLKARKPRARFTIVFPRVRTAMELNQQSVLTKIAEDCFDEVLFKNTLGWSSADSLNDSMGQATRQSNRIYSRIINRICKRFQKLSNIWQLIDKRVSAKYLKKWVLSREKDSLRTILLCDIYEEPKSYNQLFLQKMGDIPRYSIHHGLNVINGGVFNNDLNQYNVSEVEHRKVFIFSEYDRKMWQFQYGLQEEQVIPTGIMKHDKNWIKRIQDMSKEHLTSIPKRYIGVIGRPCTTSYLPRERKINVLRDIMQSAEEHNLPIVVKRHPKEKYDGTYEEAFGASTLGTTWFLTDAHWFVLAKRCVFAVSFYSGVSVDLIKLGVPVIEYLNLHGLREHDNERSLRDSNGNPVFSYRYLGLVYGVDDTQGFEGKVNEIISDRNNLGENLKSKYENVFINPDNSISEVLNLIDKNLIK